MPLSTKPTPQSSEGGSRRDAGAGTENDALQPVSLTRFVGYFLWLGTVGFGGPIALAGHMQQDLVTSRRWISKQDYVEGLALAQLAPGPLAAQLAIYLGYIRNGILGAMSSCLPLNPGLASRWPRGTPNNVITQTEMKDVSSDTSIARIVLGFAK